ncbi:MAG TPA: hypothetical protein DC017_09165 [Candidatus Wallbacteria bacterium]|nr:hypothetical protein [Candidatus Wallbacteria bacterium]
MTELNSYKTKTLTVSIFLLLLSMTYIYPIDISYANNNKHEKTVNFCMESRKKDILDKLGRGYKIVPSGGEGLCDGYYYEKLGLTLIFEQHNKKNPRVDWIKFDRQVEINGLRSGMDFEQIFRKVKKVPVYKEKVFDSNYNEYEINIIMKNGLYFINFCSDNFDGKNSIMDVSRKGGYFVGWSIQIPGGKSVYGWMVDKKTGALEKDKSENEPRPETIDLSKTYVKGKIIAVSEVLDAKAPASCCVIATENNGEYGIYLSYKYSDYRLYRNCYDNGKPFGKIEFIDCLLSGSEYKFAVINADRTNDSSNSIETECSISITDDADKFWKDLSKTRNK